MWHNEKKAYALALGKLQSSNIDPYEKQTIVLLQNRFLAEGMSKHRVIKYLQVLRIMLEKKVTPYSKMTEETLYSAMLHIRHDWGLGMEAQRDYLTALRRILTHHGKHELVRLIKIKKANIKKRLPESVVNIHDVLKLVEVAQNPRDAAIAACLFESNARPREFFNLRWGDVHEEITQVKMWDGNGRMVSQSIDIIFLDVTGKTGPRRTFLFFSAPLLLAWKRAYPTGADGYVWVDLERDLEQLKYPAARKVLGTLFKRAGIDKSSNLYATRHGRNTEVSEILSSAQQDEYAGWVPGSNMPRVYNHLNGLNMVFPILGEFGVIIDRRTSIREAWINLYQMGKKLNQNI